MFDSTFLISLNLRNLVGNAKGIKRLHSQGVISGSWFSWCEIRIQNNVREFCKRFLNIFDVIPCKRHILVLLRYLIID